MDFQFNALNAGCQGFQHPPLSPIHTGRANVSVDRLVGRVWKQGHVEQVKLDPKLLCEAGREVYHILIVVVHVNCTDDTVLFHDKLSFSYDVGTDSADQSEIES